MSKYINDNELHETVQRIKNFYEAEYGGFVKDDEIERLKKQTATVENLTHTNDRYETALGALLKFSKQITKDALKSTDEYAMRANNALQSIISKIDPKLVKEAEKEIEIEKSQPLSTFEKAKEKFTKSQAEKNEDLFTAVRKNDRQGIQNALTLGANIEARDKKGNTPLMIAAHCSNHGPIITLINSGANVNAHNYANQNALHLAGEGEELSHAKHSTEIVETLCEAGADINAVDIHGRTPAMCARNASNAIALCEAGADVTKETKDFWRNEGKEEMVKDFEKYQADLNPTYKKTDEQVAKEAEELKMANTQTHEQERGQSA